MARKFDLINELYNSTLRQVSDPSEWRAFLESACRNYRLRFDEQLLVFAQRPDATAVLEIERWNTGFGRWVNRGAKGIAVFEDMERSNQRLKYYFDVKDTHASRVSRPVPIWQMKEDYTEEVIDTLESTFGDLENRTSMEEAILSASHNAVEDNIPDYVSDLLYTVNDSLLYGLNEDTVKYMHSSLVTHSVSYMMMTRLGIDASMFYSDDDFRDIVNFNTPEAINALGYATSDIAEMALSEIAKTVLALDRENRTFVNPQRSDYNNDTIQTERSFEHDSDHLHPTGRLQSAQSDYARSADDGAGLIRSDEETVSQREPSDSLLQPPDLGEAETAPREHRTESLADGGEPHPSDGTAAGREREAESERSDEVDTADEQHPSVGARDRDERSDIHPVTPDGQTQSTDEPALFDSADIEIAYYDRSHEDKSLPFFGSDKDIMAILLATPHLKATRDEIAYFFESERDSEKQVEYLKGIFNNDYTEVVIPDGRTMGYKTFQNVLHLWEGSYSNRVSQGYYNWGVIAGYLDGMRLVGELRETAKPLPSIESQLELITGSAEEKSSAFVFSQEIIDEMLTRRGSGFAEGKFRIYEQFQKSLSRDDNIRFLKKEYGIGGANPILIGTGINEWHDGKGIMLKRGYGDDKPSILLKWNKVERRISELIKMDRYLNEKELALYPNWLREREQQRIEKAEQQRQREEERRRQIEMETAPEERQASAETYEYQYHLGDKVYLGADTYEIISLGDDRVMLYDPKYPLINKEVPREEFEKKVQDNPLNHHLRVVVNSIKQAEQEQPVSVNPIDSIDRYFELRAQNPENIILFRIGDFYEVMGDDALAVSKALDLTLTSRRRNDAERVPMVGFPVYNADSYINKLLENGWTIAAADSDTDIHVISPDREELTTESSDVDPAELRKKLEDSGIVNGELVDSEKLDANPFIQQVMADADAAAAEEDQPEEVKLRSVVLDMTPNETDGINSDLIGQRLTLDDREFEIIKVNAYSDVSLQDLTFEGEVGFPVVRIEKVGFVRRALEEQKAKESALTPAWEQQPRAKAQTFDLHPDIPLSERHTFDLALNEVEAVGKKDRFSRNIMAIRTLKTCREENRFATPEEQVLLSKYVGWGGIPEAFDADNQSWSLEYHVLKNELSEEEYTSARASTLTAFYTPPVVISAIYKVMENMGFQRGNILEPSCGIGNFIGMLPASMSESRVFGVEIDTISAGIAQQLYQRSSIAAQPFEKAEIPDSFFDAVVGNVPFGDFGVSDKRYDKHHFLIHDYFFAKSLDKLRPGGVMALVTSRGTMDKENSAVRKYIAQRADLLGAIRLPNNTFRGNAGTDVVSDILILQKRDRIIDIEPSWVHLDTDENGITMNSYFVQHPEMILGEMKMVSGHYGMTPDCIPYEDADLGELLDEAITNIHGEVTDYELDEDMEEDTSIPADPTVRNFSFTLVDGSIYFRENSRMTLFDVSATAQNRIKGMIPIRDSVRRLLEMQTENYPDEAIKAEQERLNTLYDSYTKKYGLINSRANNAAFSLDSSYSLLSSLEILDEEGNLLRKADIFTKRTIRPHEPVTSVDTASEALNISMAERACVDMDFMCELSGLSEEKIFEDLKGVIFLNPLYGFGENREPKYLTADEYLSGNVREKLKIAYQSAQLYPQDFTANVEALQQVQPEDLKASEISVRLGATWLPVEDVQKFIYQLLDTPYYAQWKMKVHYSPITGEWNIEYKTYDRTNVKAYSTYGTDRINAYQIIEQTLNLKDVRIYDYIEEPGGSKKAVLNKKETAIALAKQEAIKQQFQEWIWADPQRRERLCRLYNDKFNNTRPRVYDGSHIAFVGMNPEIELRKHQRDAVAHIIYGGNTLLAHEVGAGKTFAMTAAAMESKRLGLCNKSLFVVPNHLTEQWAAEFLQLYPAANILVATKKDFERKNRRKFCARIATGEYDAIIIGHSQFEKIPISAERQIAMLQAQLDEITDGIEALGRSHEDRYTVKQLEKSRKSIQTKLEKLNAQDRKDDVVTFEELGVDRLFIDESHYYKNLYLFTKMRNVGGIAQTEAAKSSDLFMKCRYLDELTGSRGTIFATGTPISNSMVELYTIQRYLQYETLVRHDLQYFDAWASTFGETITAVELTPEGTGYRAKTRFARFYNLPELMAMFRMVADIQTADMLDLPVPKANYHNIAVKPSEMQKEMVKALGERAEAIRKGNVDPSKDNMLNITNDGRKLALDQRLLNPLLEDFDGSKVNACVDNVYQIWNDTAEQRSTQLVFCDLSTPKNDDEFSVYTDIRRKLIERGIPEDQIRFIHEAKTEAQKLDLFRKVRNGEVRVLIGSTAKMGAGTNVQNRLIAGHDLDCRVTRS
jgi:N12 class adenine-specific DNA methylase